MSLPPNEPAAPRRCGACTACCTALGVTDAPGGAKAEFTPCPALRQGAPGCGIHADRPASCRGYVCGWLSGQGAQADRPDRSGVVLGAQTTIWGPTLTVFEVWAGAASRGRGKAIVEEHITRGGQDGRGALAILFAEGRDRRVVGPPHLLERVRLDVAVETMISREKDENSAQ